MSRTILISLFLTLCFCSNMLAQEINVGETSTDIKLPPYRGIIPIEVKGHFTVNKITKLKKTSSGTVYKIIAKKEDKTFYIFSFESSVKSKNEKIKKGETYHFVLKHIQSKENLHRWENFTFGLELQVQVIFHSIELYISTTQLFNTYTTQNLNGLHLTP